MKKLILSLVFFLSFNAQAVIKSGSVIYGVVPCLFGDQCFQGVIKKLPEMASQGVDVLWISPVFKSDDLSIISYGTTDYFKVRPDFGTDEEFAELVKTAHAHNLKVIMDIVPNHTSNAHPFFLDPKYYNFYDRDADGNHTYYFDWSYLPNLNYDIPEVRQHIKDAFFHWMSIGVDGFRVDAAWGVKERAPDFWPAFIKELKAKNKNILMLAEASAMDPYYVASGFDLAYDWTESLGIWAWNDVFTDYKKAPQKLHEALMKSNSKHVARFINNNDTGKRFITRYGVKMAKLAAVLQHTVPGTPIVYNGDETGEEFEPYEDPEPLPWTDRHNLKGFYKKLAELYGNNESLHSGSFRAIEISGDKEGVYSYARQSGNRNSIIFLNFMNDKKKIVFDYRGSIKELRNLLTEKNIPFVKISDTKYELTLSPKDALILNPLLK